MVLGAKGPSSNGIRTVVTVFNDGQVMVPLVSYAGQNSRIPITALTGEGIRKRVDALFGFAGNEKQPRTSVGWLTPERVDQLMFFCDSVASAYSEALLSVPETDLQTGNAPHIEAD